MRKVIEVIDLRTYKGPFTKKDIEVVEFIPNFTSTTKKSLQERANLLFYELSQMDSELLIEDPQVYISRLKSRYIKVPVKIPKGRADVFSDLIIERELKAGYGWNYFVTANLKLNDKIIHAVIEGNKYSDPPYNFTLFTSEMLNLEDVLLVDQLPLNPSSIGIDFDFDKNPTAREKMALVGSRRIPASLYSPRASRVRGYEDKSGLRIFVAVNLQKQSQENVINDFLLCYEIEIFKDGKLHPQTTEISRETVWQPDQLHYCMTKQDSYPLLPLEMNRVSRISFAISSPDDTKILAEILKGTPLTLNGKNQFFAEMPYEDGILSLIFKPDLQIHDTFLGYRQGSSIFFSAEQIYDGLQNIKYLRKELSSLL